MKLYLLKDSSKKQAALVLSELSNQPVDAPEFVAGDSGKEVTLYLVDGAGDFDTDSGSAAITPHLSLGTPGQPIIAGTFTVSCDGDTTAALAYNITAGALQTALNALDSVTTNDGVIVYGQSPNFQIVWLTTGTKPDFTGDGSAMTPTGAVVVQNQGDGSVTPKSSLLRLMPRSLCESTAWATSTDGNGWTAFVSTNTLESFVALAGAGSADTTLEISLEDSSNNRITELQVPTRILAPISHNGGALTNPSFPPSPEQDPIFNASAAKTITYGMIVNWTAAYSWGNHSLAGYATFTAGDARWVLKTGDTMTGSLGIYAACHASAALGITSTTKGFLPPRMTRAQRDAISNPASGLVIYQTDEIPGLYHFTGAAWLNLSSAQYCPTNGKYYPIIVQIIGGEPVLDLGNALT